MDWGWGREGEGDQDREGEGEVGRAGVVEGDGMEEEDTEWVEGPLASQQYEGERDLGWTNDRATRQGTAVQQIGVNQVLEGGKKKRKRGVNQKASILRKKREGQRLMEEAAKDMIS